MPVRCFLIHFNVSDGFGGYLGVGGLAMDYISYHASPQLMGIDPDRFHERSIFGDYADIQQSKKEVSGKGVGKHEGTWSKSRKMDPS